MAREQFIEVNFQAKSERLIRQALTIIEEMAKDGYVLTLRQLYYQFVARGWLENRQQNYDRLGKIIDKARKAGIIDWNAIEDRTRYLRSVPTFRDVPTFVRRTVDYYAEDLWRDQDAYCEVWIEKDALLGVVERPCLELRVPYFACRGYPSSSELYEAGRRLTRKVDEGKAVFVFYLGDHDPDGIHMGYSNAEWIDTYSRYAGIDLVRVALNLDQVEEYSPPPNPAKETSARYGDYALNYGNEAWELDALAPAVIDKIIREYVEHLIEWDKWDINVERERVNRELYRKFGENIDAIKHRMEW